MATAAPSSSSVAIRVMVLADVRLYREGLTRLLSSDGRLTIVGIGAVDGEALGRIAAARPDIVLIDAAHACESPIVRDVARIAPATRVVAYGVQDEEHQALRCAENGASAFVLGEAGGDELIETILALVRGEFRCSPRIAAMLVRRVSTLTQSVGETSRAERLTPRERGIVGLIDEGLSNKEIARRLGIELSTVKNHVHHILEKLHALRRAQAAAHFRRMELLERASELPGPRS